MTDYRYTDSDGDRVEVDKIAGKAAVTVVDGYNSASASAYVPSDEADRFVTALYDNAGLLPDVERGKADDLLMFTTHEGTRYVHEGAPALRRTASEILAEARALLATSAAMLVDAADAEAREAEAEARLAEARRAAAEELTRAEASRMASAWARASRPRYQIMEAPDGDGTLVDHVARVGYPFGRPTAASGIWKALVEARAGSLDAGLAGGNSFYRYAMSANKVIA